MSSCRGSPVSTFCRPATVRQAISPSPAINTAAPGRFCCATVVSRNEIIRCRRCAKNPRVSGSEMGSGFEVSATAIPSGVRSGSPTTIAERSLVDSIPAAQGSCQPKEKVTQQKPEIEILKAAASSVHVGADCPPVGLHVDAFTPILLTAALLRGDTTPRGNDGMSNQPSSTPSWLLSGDSRWGSRLPSTCCGIWYILLFIRRW